MGLGVNGSGLRTRAALGAVVGVALLSSCAPAMAGWAIAFSQGARGAYGYNTAYNDATQDEAAARAINACSQRRSRCRIIASGVSGCVALAITQRSNGWGSASRTTPQDAHAHAVVNCQTANPGRVCTVETAFCDTTGADE